jgi:broad specificity phosphatase PhoE
MSVQVLLIRPGATLYDEEHRVQGALELPLSPRGEIEAARLARELAARPLVVLYHAPGESAERTAEAIADAVGARTRCLEDLRNLDHGLWQGLQLEELRRRNARVFRQWIEEPATVCPPQGETVERAMERVRDALRPLLKRHRAQAIGLVVAEPLARLVRGCLLREPHLAFEEDPRTGFYETIDVADDLPRNGA